MRRRYYRPPDARMPLQPNDGGWSAAQANALNSAEQAYSDTDPNTANTVLPIPFEYSGFTAALSFASTSLFKTVYTLLDDGTSNNTYTQNSISAKTLPTPAQMVGIVDGIHPFAGLSGSIPEDSAIGFSTGIFPINPAASFWSITINGRDAQTIPFIRSSYSQSPSSRPLLYLRPGEALGASFTYIDPRGFLHGGHVGIRVTGYFAPISTIGGVGWKYQSQGQAPTGRRF